MKYCFEVDSMKKIIVFGLTVSASAVSVAAQNYPYGMMGSGMGGTYSAVYGLVFLALASLIFSIIFWLSYKLIVKPKK